ncbi:MAG TPA: SDR family oxidoreductase [Tepidisphaeraceae bacterium]|jgi:putative NADH-flavin reductase
MNLAVFGATGPSGRELLKLALEQGHRVTASARNPDKITDRHERLKVVKGDILNPESVREAVAGADAVISVLGVRKLGKNTILSDGTRNIIAAMQSQNVRRFICETSLSVGDSLGQMSWIFEKVALPLLLKNAFADKEIQEKYVMQSQLDWTIVRPAMLTNGPRTGVYKTWVGKPTDPIRRKISRADVADFILKQAASSEFTNRAVGLSY